MARGEVSEMTRGEGVIALHAVAARTAPLARSSLTLEWGPGLHALVGTPADGGPLLLAVIAARERLRAGTVRVLGGAPGGARVRPQIALVALTAALPAAMRVHEVLALAAALRGEPARPAGERLAILGIEALAPRIARSLAPEEARAVAMAEAVTSTRVRVLLLDEPLVQIDPRASARLPEVLRANARRGVSILFATASVRDAGELADDHVLLQSGVVVGRAASLDALSGFAPRAARMRVLASDPPALVAALAREADVESVARRDGLVVARGRDATALAKAVARAVLASGAEVTEVRLEPPSLDEVRAAAAGVAQGTFEAARARTLASLEGLPPQGTS